ncbi:MAG: alpha/beta hydrolase [Cyanobacteria bacterium P01_F01_bin.33]
MHSQTVREIAGLRGPNRSCKFVDCHDEWGVSRAKREEVGDESAMWLAIFSILLSVIGLFLSTWIVLPAPTFFLLPLSVGAPELAPWLLVGNGLATAIAINLRSHPIRYVSTGVALLGVGLSCLPLLQLPSVVRDANAAFEQQLGIKVTALDPLHPYSWRQQPFSALDAFRGIPPLSVRHDSAIPFATPAGILLTLDVYHPVKASIYPAIVTAYGGAWQRGSRADHAEFNRYMAARGYVVFAISYRHAPQFQFPAQQEDVRAALDWIERNAADYGADRDRVAILGRSAGAHLALLQAYSDESPPIRAAIDFYGPVDLVQGYQFPPTPDPINTRTTLETFLGGSPAELLELYRQASPITYVKEGLPPTLLLYGGRDNVVQAKYGRALAERLLDKGNTALLIEIPWADHAYDTIFNGVSSQLSLYYIERFLAQTLGG